MADQTPWEITVKHLVRQIRVPYEPQEEVRAAIRELAAIATCGAGDPLPGCQLLAPSWSGKSTVLRAICKEMNEAGDLPAGHMPAPYIEIDAEGSMGAVATDILRGLGERRPDLGKPSAKWEKVRHVIAEKKVRVLVFDEFQRAGKSPALSPVIVGKIQSFMDNGLATAFFSGKPEALEIFKRIPDILNRMDVPVRLEPLRWFDKRDRRVYTNFLQRFDEQLVASKVLTEPSGLAAENVAVPLLEASAGLIGYTCRILETAAMSIARRKLTTLRASDLRDAVQDWAVDNGRISKNPFA